MKRQVATLFVALLWHTTLAALYLEVNASYDYFRGAPDGTWNGNNGALIALNGAIELTECADFQLGGSFGAYNWDGRGNLVFRNSKKVEEIGFLTTGLTFFRSPFTAGILYDHLFTSHFGLYNLSPSIDQLRFQAGYEFCAEEVGIWGTTALNTSHKHALGVPIRFRAISQINLFWSHRFQNCAKTTLWIGLPYRKGLKPHHKTPGRAIAGFAVRVPLNDRLFIEGYGSYLWARSAHGVKQSRNYGASLALGITYAFFCPDPCAGTYMPIANHSNFYVDTNANQ